jgi:MFS family permease
MTGVAACAALSAVAPSGGLLVASRVLGAAVGAAAGPSSVSMINRMYDRHERARALGWWSMVAAGGPVLGVVIGGPVVEAFSWRWIFVAQAPLTLGAVALGWRVLPNFAGRREVRFDVPGTVLLALGSVALLVALNRGPAVGWTHPVVVGGFAACPALLAAFVAVERRSSSPLLPLRYVRERNVSAAVTNQFFLNFAYMGAFTLTPLMLAGVLGWGETKIGLLSIARPLTFAVAGPVAGALAVRVGERTNALVGGAAIAASMVGLSTTGPGSSETVIAVSLALSGLGMGAAAPAMAAALANAVDEHDLGVAAAFQQMCSQIGVVVGTQIMLSVQQGLAPARASNRDGDAVDPASLPAVVLDELVGSYRWAYLVGAAAALLGAVAALAVRRSDRRMAAGDLLADELEILDGGSNPVVPGP